MPMIMYLFTVCQFVFVVEIENEWMNDNWVRQTKRFENNKLFNRLIPTTDMASQMLQAFSVLMYLNSYF